MKTQIAPTLLKRPVGIAAASCMLLAASSSFAADLTWLYDTGSYDWDLTSEYWNDGVSDTAWTNGDAAIFNGFSDSSTLTLQNNVTATSITRNDTNGTKSLTIDGGATSSTSQRSRPSAPSEISRSMPTLPATTI